VERISRKAAMRENGLQQLLADPSSLWRIRHFEERVQELRAATILQPLIHVGHPGEVAALAHFLASSDRSLITGQTIALDGGKSAGISRAVQHLVAWAASQTGPGSDGQ
jgi:NAD(P)-dependent dehydrogenase (short-subunit alcohol dehydrogenase family)